MIRRRKKLLDDLKDRRGYSHLKEKALDRTMLRNRFKEALDLSSHKILNEWINIKHTVPPKGVTYIAQQMLISQRKITELQTKPAYKLQRYNAPYNLPWTHRRGVEGRFYSFFNLGVGQVWWSTPRPAVLHRSRPFQASLRCNGFI
jgi:hypothetical protein